MLSRGWNVHLREAYISIHIRYYDVTAATKSVRALPYKCIQVNVGAGSFLENNVTSSHFSNL